MKILIDTSFFGGSGGLEKLVKDIILEKSDDMIIDIFVSSGINSEPLFKFTNTSFKNLENIKYEDYDLYLKVGTNYNFNICDKLKTSCIKIINPAGYIHMSLEEMKKFHFLWQESPSAYEQFEYLKKITLCPPVTVDYKPTSSNPIVDNITKKFFVTAANDYDVYIKGIDLIYKFAEISNYDIVWFCSDNKLPTTNLKPRNVTPAKLKIARNFSKNVIFDTISKSHAYISFSRKESFGYSIAEALLLNKPVITQKVGLVKYNPDLFYIYDEKELEKINNFNFEQKNYSFITDNFNFFWDKLLSAIR